MRDAITSGILSALWRVLLVSSNTDFCTIVETIHVVNSSGGAVRRYSVVWTEDYICFVFHCSAYKRRASSVFATMLLKAAQ